VSVPRRIAAIALPILAFLALAGLALRYRPAVSPEYDPAYWAKEEARSGDWLQGVTPAGIAYALYLPASLESPGESPEGGGSVPLIAVFHGSNQKDVSRERFGSLFADPAAQAAFGPAGAAVLVPLSRTDYFSDPASYARFIENVALRHPAIDPRRIAGYGFSQGAAFVMELAMARPALFRAAAAGSSYYEASAAELFAAARVRFYCALSRDDKGIFEQGAFTAKLLSRICPDSRYVEYENRGHFPIGLRDTGPRGGETFIDWLAESLR